MKRKVLFRGQRINSKEWVYGSIIETNQFIKHMPWLHSKFWIATNSFGNGGWFNIRQRYHVSSETVGQFTQYSDKNGVMIFEDDICKCNDIIYNLVKHESGAYELHEEGNDKVFFLYRYAHIIEVIGNIHEGGET